VLVTEWMTGAAVEVISGGSQEMRDRAGKLLAHFLVPGPARTGLLHAIRIGQLPAADRRRPGVGRRLGLLDSPVDRLPEGLPLPIGTALWLALAARPSRCTDAREEGFVKPTISLARTRCWTICGDHTSRPTGRTSVRAGVMRAQAARIADPRSPAHQFGQAAEQAAVVLLIHRVTLSTVGVLCQLGATVRLRENCTGGCRVLIRRGRGARVRWPRYHQAESRRLFDAAQVLAGAGDAEVDALPFSTEQVQSGADPRELPAAGRTRRGRSARSSAVTVWSAAVSAVGVSAVVV